MSPKDSSGKEAMVNQTEIQAWRECLAARLADPACEPELVEVARTELVAALERRTEDA